MTVIIVDPNSPGSGDFIRGVPAGKAEEAVNRWKLSRFGKVPEINWFTIESDNIVDALIASAEAAR